MQSILQAFVFFHVLVFIFQVRLRHHLNMQIVSILDVMNAGVSAWIALYADGNVDLLLIQAIQSNVELVDASCVQLSSQLQFWMGQSIVQITATPTYILNLLFCQEVQ